MRKMLFLSLLSAFLGCESSFSVNENKSIVFEAYKAAVLEPELFDSYIEEYKLRENNFFMKCMNNVQLNLTTKWKKQTEYCNGLPTSQARSLCRQNDLLDISGVLEDMVRAVRGTPFTSTFRGSALVLGRNVLGSSEYERLTRSYLPAYENLLSCN